MQVSNFLYGGCPYKFVITGGPSHGKTSLVRALVEKGKYQSFPEVATFIIKTALQRGGEHPIQNRDKFQKDVREMQVKLESELKKDIPAFLDRGLLDGIAYYHLDELDPPEDLINKAKEVKYNLIFLLEPLESHEKNEVRTEDFSTALKIHNLIHKVYQDFGYEIIEVPCLGIKKRVEFVLKHVDEYLANTLIPEKVSEIKHHQTLRMSVLLNKF